MHQSTVLFTLSAGSPSPTAIISIPGQPVPIFSTLYTLYGTGNGNPLQYSCLENPMDRGAWQATVHGVVRVGHDLATKPPPYVL